MHVTVRRCEVPASETVSATETIQDLLAYKFPEHMNFITVNYWYIHVSQWNLNLKCNAPTFLLCLCPVLSCELGCRGSTWRWDPSYFCNRILSLPGLLSFLSNSCSISALRLHTQQKLHAPHPLYVAELLILRMQSFQFWKNTEETPPKTKQIFLPY